MFNFLMLACACGFTACSGIGALQEKQYNNIDEKVEFHQEIRKLSLGDNEFDLSNTNVVYDDSNYIITISDLPDNYPLTEFCSLSNNVFQSILFGYDNNNYTLQMNENDMLVFGTAELYKIIAPTGNYNEVNQSFGSNLFTQNYTFAVNDNSLSWIHDFSIRSTSTYYDDIKSAILLDIPLNNQYADMPAVLGDFVSILVGGIQTLATGVANGVVSMATALFLTTNNGQVTGLSVFGGIVAIFAGLALAIGITTKVYTWVTSLGN